MTNQASSYSYISTFCALGYFIKSARPEQITACSCWTSSEKYTNWNRKSNVSFPAHKSRFLVAVNWPRPRGSWLQRGSRTAYYYCWLLQNIFQFNGCIHPAQLSISLPVASLSLTVTLLPRPQDEQRSSATVPLAALTLPAVYSKYQDFLPTLRVWFSDSKTQNR